MRLITPIYNLKDVYIGNNTTLSQVKNAIKNFLNNATDHLSIENYNYQIRIFSCIVKSAARDIAYNIIEAEDKQETLQLLYYYIIHLKGITTHFRQLWDILKDAEIEVDQKDIYMFADEFIGNIVEQQTFRIMKGLSNKPFYKEVKHALYQLVDEELNYKKSLGYLTLNPSDTTNNYLVVMRRNILKKIIESDLYLNTKKTKDGAFAEQFYYGIAAGVSMIFATIVAFTAQLKYGNFTVPLFFALVVSYIFKDRIKELMRYYFSNQLGKRYFDNKHELEIIERKIGWTKEAFVFTAENKIPQKVLALRKRTALMEAENKIYTEQVILYKKSVQLEHYMLNENATYHFIGINDITRFNIIHFVQNIDNPYITLYTPNSKSGYSEFEGEKIYVIHFIIQFTSQKGTHYPKFRLLFNRNGIKSIIEIKE